MTAGLSLSQSAPSHPQPRRQAAGRRGGNREAQIAAPSLVRHGGNWSILLPVLGPMPRVTSHRLISPRRWYVDLQPAIKATRRVEWRGQGWFKDMRLGQFTNQPGSRVVRLVIDLPASGAVPRLAIQPHGLIIRSGGALASVQPRRARIRLAALRHPMLPARRRRLARASALRSAAPAPGLAPPLPAPAPAIAPGVPYPHPAPRPLLPAPQAPQIPASLLHPSPLSRANPNTPPQYTGERITLRLKNASLKDFFRIIHEVSGLNVIVDSDVQGTVTMMMRDVPWDQAFALVIHDNSLGYRLEGNVLRISKLSTLISEQKQRQLWRDAVAERSPLELHLVRLSYISANAVAKTLSHRYILGKRGRLIPNTVSSAVGTAATGQPSTLLVLAAKRRMPNILALIAQLDQRRPQIQIEARVVSTTRSYARELGVQLAMLIHNASTLAGGVPGLGPSPVGAGLPLNTNLGATAPSSGISIVNASQAYEVDAILTATESKGLGHVLSAPRIVTQDNQPAMVEQGVRIPLQTTINNTISVQMFNATLRLMVTPRMTPDGHIFLTVNVRNESIDAGIPRIQGMPAIDTQAANTQVLVDNGGTAVIGGVIIRNKQNSVFQVPVLGDVPVVGNLFKHTSITTSDQELLFFITPRLVKS